MTFKVELPTEIEKAYRAEAQAKGVAPEEWLREVLIARKCPSVEPHVARRQGLGLFGSPEDAALLDEIVALAYQERRRPTQRSTDP